MAMGVGGARHPPGPRSGPVAVPLTTGSHALDVRLLRAGVTLGALPIIGDLLRAAYFVGGEDGAGHDPESFVRAFGVEALELLGVKTCPYPACSDPGEWALGHIANMHERNPPEGSAAWWEGLAEEAAKSRREEDAAAERARVEADLQRVRAQHGTGDAYGRASAYLAACDGAVSGQGRSDTAWGVVLRVVRGFALGERDALALLESEYAPRCQPRLPHAELRGMVRRAMSASKPPWGCLLEQRREGR